jgi:hypothetical protein
MLIRRIAVSACALALVVPAAAVARPAVDPPVAKTGAVTYGDTKYDLQNQKDQKAAKPAYADRVGSLSAEQLAAAYGTAKPTAEPFAYGAAAPNARFVPTTAASADAASDGDSGWQIAALSEAGLLAAFGLGSVALLRGRRRARVA